MDIFIIEIILIFQSTVLFSNKVSLSFDWNLNQKTLKKKLVWAVKWCNDIFLHLIPIHIQTIERMIRKKGVKKNRLFKKTDIRTETVQQ